MCAFGAIVVVSAAAPGDTDVMQAFIAELISQQNAVATTALSLLLVSVLAMALSTMSSLFSASLCTFRYDILPILWPEPASGGGRAFERGDGDAAHHCRRGRALPGHPGVASYLFGEISG